MKRIITLIASFFLFLSIGNAQIKGTSFLYFEDAVDQGAYAAVITCCSELSYRLDTQTIWYWDRASETWKPLADAGIILTEAVSAPLSGNTGDIWLNTLTNQLSFYDGVTWHPADGARSYYQDSTGLNLPTALVDPVAPANPIDGDLVIRQYDDGSISSIYNGATWDNMAARSGRNTPDLTSLAITGTDSIEYWDDGLNDYRRSAINQMLVTSLDSAGLRVTESQISDLVHTVEINDLTSAVTWANVPNANITVGSVTQHEAALTIIEGQITGAAFTNWNTAYGWGDHSTQGYLDNTDEQNLSWVDGTNTINISGGTGVVITGFSETGHTHTFASLTSKPTTIAGYGITDYNSLWDTRLATKTTTNLAEGTNLYYTEGRVSANSSVVANTAKITNATHTGDVTGATVLTIAVDAVDIPMLSATGTASETTFLRGDNTWAAPSDADTQLTEEQVEDFVGGMLGGTETLITVTYQDVTNDIDFVVENDLSLYDNTTSNFADGTGASNQIAWWSDANTLTSNANWIYDGLGYVQLKYTTPRMAFTDTDGTGDAATGYIEFYDQTVTRLGYVGYGSGGNSTLYVHNESGGMVQIPSKLHINVTSGVNLVLEKSSGAYLTFEDDGVVDGGINGFDLTDGIGIFDDAGLAVDVSFANNKVAIHALNTTEYIRTVSDTIVGGTWASVNLSQFNNDLDASDFLSGLTDNYIPVYDAASNDLEDSPIFTDGTDVGIGTATPAVALDISKSASGSATQRLRNSHASGFSGTEYLDNGGTVDFYLGLEQGGGDARYNILNSGDHVFYGNSVERMRIENTGNVGIGTISPTLPLHVVGKTHTTTDFVTGRNIYANFSTNLHDDRWEMAPMSGISIGRNSQFYNDLSGYAVYDNAGSGAVTLSRITDATAPNGSGYYMRYTYTTGVGTPSPGLGGFYVGYTEGIYEKGDYIVYSILAKIPVGYTIAWASNAYGTEGVAKWLTDVSGTGTWKEYRFFQKIGETGSFNSTGFFFFSGADATINVDVARFNAVAVNRASSIFEQNDILYYRDTDVKIITEANIGAEIGLTGLTTNYVTKYNGTDLADSQIFDNGTNVGIGTTTPDTKTHIYDNASVVVKIESETSGAGISLYGGSDGLGSGQSSINYYDQNVYQWGILGTSGENFSIWNHDLAAIQQTWDDNGDTYFMAGSVGIGTTTPTKLLTINSGAAPSLSQQLIQANGAGGLSMLAYTPDNVSLGFDAEYNGAWKSLDAGSSAWVYKLDDQLQFKYGTAAVGATVTPYVAMVVDLLDGDIGIGTETPTFKLDVTGAAANGVMRVTSTSTYGNATIGSYGKMSEYPLLTSQISSISTDAVAIDKGGGISFGGSYTGSTTTEWAAIFGKKENATDGQYGGYLQFSTRVHGGVGAERMRITSVGDVGIGTTTPTNYSGYQTLTVNGTSGGVVNTQFNGVDGIRIGSQTGGSFVFEERNLPIYFSTNSLERMRISEGGDVGIGTATPLSLTHLEKADDPALRITRGGVNMVILGDTGSGNAGDLILYNSSGTIKTYLTGGTNDTYFIGDGNVGIGTASPIYEIDVSGSGRVTENMKVGSGALSPWTTTTYNTYQANGASLMGGATQFYLQSNAYWDGVNWKYIAAAAAAGIYSTGTDIIFRNATTGTPDANLTFVERLKIVDNDYTNVEYLKTNGIELIAGDWSTAGIVIGDIGEIPSNYGLWTDDGDGTISRASQINTTGQIRADLGTTGTSLILTGTGSNFQINHDGTSWLNIFNSGGGFRFRNPSNTATNLEIPSTIDLTDSDYLRTTGDALAKGTWSSATGVGSALAMARIDNRTIAPSEDAISTMTFGFTSWANNSTPPYADYLHLRSYSDASGGSDNLVTWLKAGFGMRQWQQTFGSATPYAAYVAYLHDENLSTGIVPYYNASTEELNDSPIFTDGTDVGIGTTSPSEMLHLFRLAHATDLQIKIENDGYTAGAETSLLFSTKGTAGTAYTSRISNQQESTVAGNLVFEVDNTLEAMRITKAGNVGIGTTTPSEKLVVDGAIVTTGALTASQTNAGVFSRSNNEIRLRAYGATAGTGELVFRTGGGGGSIDTEAMRIDENQNVGIGTTTPTHDLEVYGGDIGFSGTVAHDLDQGLYFSDAGNKDYSITRTSGAWVGTGYQQLQLKWMTGIVLDPGSGTYGKSHVGVVGGMSIGDTYYTTEHDNGLIVQGDVGIGTATPAARLDIDAGSNTTGIRLRGLAETVEIADIYMATDGSLTLSTVNGTASRGYIGIRPDDTDYGLIVRDGTGATTNYANLFMNDAATDYLNIVVNATNATAGLVIDDDNNVGIGTTTPSHALEVHQNGSFGHADWGGIRVENATTGLVGTFKVGSVASDYVALGTDSDDELRIRTNSLDRITITNDGNVGIGTTAPLARNHISMASAAIAEVLRLELNTNVSEGDKLRLSFATKLGLDSQIRQVGAIDGIAVSVGASHHGSLAFSTMNATTLSERMRITNTGKVGIGTTTPDGRLEISAALNGSGYGLHVNTNTRTPGEDYIWFGDDVTPDFVINTSNDVGIGIATPLAKLHVKEYGEALRLETTHATGYNYMTFHDGTESKGYLGYGGSTGLFQVVNYDGDIQFYTGASEAMRIVGNDVGIGTATPSYLLDVNSGDGAVRIGPNASYTEDLLLGGWGTGTTSAWVRSSNGNLHMDAKANSLIYLNHYHAGNVVMATGGGDVGIGTATPVDKLHVEGNIYLGTTSRTVYTSGAAELKIQSNTGDVGFNTLAGTRRMTIDASTGNVGIGTTTPETLLHIEAINATYTDFESIIDGSITGSGGEPAFTVAVQGDALRTRIGSNFAYSDNIPTQRNVGRSSGMLEITNATTGTGSELKYITWDQASTSDVTRLIINEDGDVGIGTTSPATAMAIQRGVGQNAYVEIAGNNNTLGSASLLVGQNGSNVGYLWNRANGPILFGTNSAERMEITAAGDLELVSLKSTSNTVTDAEFAVTVDTLTGKLEKQRFQSGDWTPTISITVGNATGTFSGIDTYYMIIGDKVMVGGSFAFTATGGTADTDANWKITSPVIPGATFRKASGTGVSRFTGGAGQFVGTVITSGGEMAFRVAANNSGTQTINFTALLDYN